MSSNKFITGLCGSLLAVVLTTWGCEGKTELGISGGTGGDPVGVVVGNSGGAGGNPGGAGGNPGGGTGGTPLMGGTGGTATTQADAGQPTGCSNAGDATTPATIDDLRATLARRWILCSPLGLFDKPQVGVDITAGDRFLLLGRDAAGNVVEEQGADFDGSVDYVANDYLSGPETQVNFTSDLGFTIISGTVTTTNPTMLIINNEGVEEYRYLADDGS